MWLCDQPKGTAGAMSASALSAAPSAAASAHAVSSEIGACAPCCSVAPKGTRTMSRRFRYSETSGCDISWIQGLRFPGIHLPLCNGLIGARQRICRGRVKPELPRELAHFGDCRLAHRDAFL